MPPASHTDQRQSISRNFSLKNPAKNISFSFAFQRMITLTFLSLVKVCFIIIFFISIYTVRCPLLTWNTEKNMYKQIYYMYHLFLSTHILWNLCATEQCMQCLSFLYLYIFVSEHKYQFLCYENTFVDINTIINYGNKKPHNNN